MRIIKKKNLTQSQDSENKYETILTINGQLINISIEPDDIKIEKTIELANKIISNLERYEESARRKITENYLKKYNQNWRNDEAAEPELDESTFNANLTLISISFLADSIMDFFYSENGMFGNLYLIAQSFNGETFDDTAMYE